MNSHHICNAADIQKTVATKLSCKDDFTTTGSNCECQTLIENLCYFEESANS